MMITEKMGASKAECNTAAHCRQAVISCNGTPNKTEGRRRKRRRQSRWRRELERVTGLLCGMAVSVHLVVMHPNSAEFRIRLLEQHSAVVRCAPQALLETTTLQASVGGLLGHAATRQSTSIISWTCSTRALETTVHPPCTPLPPFLLSYFDLPFLGLLHHIWTPFYNFLLCFLSSYHVSNENGEQNQAIAGRRIRIKGSFDRTHADSAVLDSVLSDFRENVVNKRFHCVWSDVLCQRMFQRWNKQLATTFVHIPITTNFSSPLLVFSSSSILHLHSERDVEHILLSYVLQFGLLIYL